MKTPLQTVSLSAFVALVASCSIPVIEKQDSVSPNAPVMPAQQALAQIDFHRPLATATCGSAACKQPTRKTLALDYSPEPSAPISLHLQPAVAKLLNEPHGTGALAPVASPQDVVRNVSQRELSIYFDYASANLGQDARTQLNDALNGPISAHRISIRGRTDGHGATPANQRLALARAQAVRQHLLSRDPSLSKVIELEARGTCCYVAPNATASGRALNRRVEVTVFLPDADA